MASRGINKLVRDASSPVAAGIAVMGRTGDRERNGGLSSAAVFVLKGAEHLCIAAVMDEADETMVPPRLGEK